MRKRRRRNTRFKFKVALEAAKGNKTVNQLASEFELRLSQISEWKHRLLDEGASIFRTSAARQRREEEAVQAELNEQIVRLKSEALTGNCWHKSFTYSGHFVVLTKGLTSAGGLVQKWSL